jgi:predicted RNA binding protein YcfA (HicA-like mRNA interferase family)
MSPALPIASGKETIRALELVGFVRNSQRGSHIKMRHSDGRIAIVPDHNELARGTLRSILRQAQADLDVGEFIKLTKG